MTPSLYFPAVYLSPPRSLQVYEELADTARYSEAGLPNNLATEVEEQLTEALEDLQVTFLKWGVQGFWGGGRFRSC